MENAQVTPPSALSLWQLDNKNSNTHKVELVDPEGWHKARLHSDGHIVMTRYMDQPCGKDEEDEYLSRAFFHISDLDDMISRLTEIRDVRNELFGIFGQSENLS